MRGGACRRHDVGLAEGSRPRREEAASTVHSVNFTSRLSPSTFCHKLTQWRKWRCCLKKSWGRGGALHTAIKKRKDATALYALLKILRLHASSITLTMKWTVWIHIYKFLCFTCKLLLTVKKEKSKKIKISTWFAIIAKILLPCFSWADNPLLGRISNGESGRKQTTTTCGTPWIARLQ